jgi:hypothetical protein
MPYYTSHVPDLKTLVTVPRDKTVAYPSESSHSYGLAIGYKAGDARIIAWTHSEQCPDRLPDDELQTEFAQKLPAPSQACIESGSQLESFKKAELENAFLILSEKSLAQDWLRPEEDEAWAHLQ